LYITLKLFPQQLQKRQTYIHSIYHTNEVPHWSVSDVHCYVIIRKLQDTIFWYSSCVSVWNKNITYTAYLFCKVAYRRYGIPWFRADGLTQWEALCKYMKHEILIAATISITIFRHVTSWSVYEGTSHLE
jgi:hypothetical protein